MPSAVRRAGLVVLCGAVFGCSSESLVESGEGGSGGGGGGGGAPATAQCPAVFACWEDTCVANAPGDEVCDDEFACNLPKPCDRADFNWDATGEVVSLDDSTAATCVLEGLRDGQEATYHFYGTSETMPGQFATTVTLQVRPNRLALVTIWDQQDLSALVTYRGPLELRDAAYFEGCLLETDPDAIYDCLVNATLDCTP